MTCAGDRCCKDASEDIAVCEYYAGLPPPLGFPYNSDMDPNGHLQWCWVEWADPDQTAEMGCVRCDIGCKYLNDSVNMLVGRMSHDGSGYLRSAIEHPWGRDAQGRIFDLKSNKELVVNAVLIGRHCVLERASCRENRWAGGEHNEVCWGHHVCQCSPVPDHVPPCFGGAEPHERIPGLVGDYRFYAYQGWPPQTHGYNVGDRMFCRNFLHSESLGEFPVPDQRGSLNAIFLRGESGYAFDKLTYCAGRIATTTCINGLGEDCTYGTAPGRESILGDYYNQHEASRGIWNEVRIQDQTVARRMPKNPTPEEEASVNLINEALEKILTEPFPCDVSVNPSGWVVFDRLQMPESENRYLGDYERKWTHWPLPDYPSTLLDLPHSYTRWGRVPVHAHLCLTWIRIRLYLQIAHQGYFVNDTIQSEEWYAPYSYVEIDAKTGIWAEFAPGAPTAHVGGEQVTIINPPCGPDGMVGMPAVTPAGNGLVLCKDDGEPLHVPRWIRYRARLGSFSDPPIAPVVLDQDDLPVNCAEVATTIGQWSVPGMADRLASKPQDPNQTHIGAIVFEVIPEA